MPHPLINDHPDLATAVAVLDKWIEHTMHRSHLPGLAIGIIYDDALLWGKGYGYADVAAQTPVTLDTHFRIASISKSFTATAILQLRDAGKLRLDDPVSKYLDWFQLRCEDAPEITIHNLLTHTSGLPRDSHKPLFVEYDVPDWDELIRETAKRQPTRPPYTKYAYSNLGYALLGGIIQAVSGQSWADYLREHVLDPLGMTQTFPRPEADDPLLAKGYSRFDQNYERVVMPFYSLAAFEAAGNIASSINDMVKYTAYHLSDDRTPILSIYSLRDMHRIHWAHEDWKGGYGLGISFQKIEDWVIHGHGGGYVGYLSSFLLSREHKMGLILLTNTIDSNPTLYAHQGIKLVLPEIIKATEEEEPEADPAWRQYVGDYVSDWYLARVIVRDNQLQIISLDFIDSPASILEPTDEPHVFILDETNQSNETARFELDADGKVVKLWYRNEYMTPKV